MKARLAAGDITQGFFDAQSEVLEASMENLEQTETELRNQQLLSAQQLEADLTGIKKQGAADRAQIEQDTQAKILDTIDQSLSKAGQLVNTFGQLFEAQKQKELSAAGDNAAKREAIEEKFAKRQKTISIIQSIINTAQGVTKAIAQGGILGIVTGAIVAAAGLAQIAIIRSQKFTEGGKVQKGSEVPGAPKTGDNTLAAVKPGEVILNERQQAAAGGAEFFRRLGVPGFASGGIVGGRVAEPDVSVGQRNQIATLVGGMKVTLNVNELHDAEDELSVINETAEL